MVSRQSNLFNYSREGITQGMCSSRGHCFKPSYEKYPKHGWVKNIQILLLLFILLEDGNIIHLGATMLSPPTLLNGHQQPSLSSIQYLAPNMDRSCLSSLQIQNFCLNVPIRGEPKKWPKFGFCPNQGGV